LVSSDAPGDAIAHLLDGTIDLTWGGPMRVMSAHDRDDQSPLVCFGEVVSKDPFFLIGNSRPFELPDLAHLRFATVSEVQAETDRAGDILYAASSRGPTVYTSCITTRSKVAAYHDAFVAVTRALAKMQQWLYVHSGRDLAEAVASFFPNVPQELLARSLQRYLDAGLWARDPAMSTQGFERLGASFLSGGSLKRAPVFENCVDASLA
jgi:NitT/TauT family transport system substrate-binding protein